jgi:hypothetical protein
MRPLCLVLAITLLSISIVIIHSPAVSFYQTITLNGHIVDEETRMPLSNVIVSLGDMITYTNNDGYYEFTSIPLSGLYLFTATKSNYEDYGKKITVSEESNQYDLSLRSTGTYNGEAEIEYEISIPNPETSYAHVKGTFKDLAFETMHMDMHYVYDTGISIENIAVVNKNGEPLPFELTQTYDGFYWYNLEIARGSRDNLPITLEYDIHYVSICHNGDPDCYHAYICDSYGVFENMNHVLFAGSAGDSLGDSIAIRFYLPPGWVTVTPWIQQGDFFVSSHPSYLFYGTAGVGRFELHKETVRDTEVTIGIHENANSFASVSVDIQSVMNFVQVADSWLHFGRPFSIVVGIPPLGTNETAWRSMYSPSTYFPHGFSAALCLVDDIEWIEGKWLLPALTYYTELTQYKGGFWSSNTYYANVNNKKDMYLNEIHGTPYDLPIPDYESNLGPEYAIARDVKTYLFLYILDYEVRKVTLEEQTLTDVMVCWRERFSAEPHTHFTDTELLETLNTCTGYDFTEFFDRYYLGTEKYPIEMEWDPWLSAIPLLISPNDKTITTDNTPIFE